MSDRYDSKYNITYKAMTVVNNDDLAIRCKVKDANRCVYAIKASAKQNSDMLFSLRSGIQNGYINLLVSETDVEDKWGQKIKGFAKLPDTIKAKLRLPYYQTTFLINEMINLQHDMVNGNVKIKEKSGMRKDRYSSLLYNYYVVQEVSRKRRSSYADESEINKIFSMRKGARNERNFDFRRRRGR